MLTYSRVTLIAGRKGGIMSDESLECIATFPSAPLAEMARMHLEANGITAVVSSDDCGSWEPWLQNSLGVRVLVRRDDVERAGEILQETRDSNP